MMTQRETAQITSPSASAKPGPSSSTEAAIAFLWLSLGLMVITITLSLFLPSALAYSVCAALYVAKFIAERALKITSPLTIALLVAYGGLLGAEWLGVDTTGYSGAVLFSWLALVVGTLLAIGRPFTTFYSHGKGLRSVHIAVSVVWLIAYLTALAATFALMPSILFLFVPAAICLAGGAATLWINFVWCGRRNARRTETEIGDFRFRQISLDDPAFNLFCEKFAQAVSNDPRQKDATKTWQQVASLVEQTERQLGGHSFVFVCEHKDAIVGAVRCVLDHPVFPLPTEQDVGSSFDGLRTYGKLMLVGRLNIDEGYRGRPEVMSGLFRCFVDLALERDISYVITSGLTYMLPTHLKLGFEFMYGRKDPRHSVRGASGFVSYPLIMNFETMVMQRTSVDEKFEFKEAANAYLSERWFKRAVMRRFLRRLRRRSNLTDIAAIQQVLLPQVPVRQAA